MLVKYANLVKIQPIPPDITLLAESLRSFLDKSGKRVSRKIEGDSVRRVSG